MRERAAAVKAELGLEDNPVQTALLEAIDPTQYECSSAVPPVVSAILPDVSAWTFEQVLAVLHVLIFDIASVDAAYLPQTGPYTYGARGEYTNQINRNIRDLKTFWDIPSSDIGLVPAHGRSMLDPEVNYRVFTKVYGLPPGPSRISADLVARELNSAALGYGDLPLFGTPNQRMRSALWACSVADAARVQGTILPARSFYDLFVTQYPTLIAPDATT